MNPLNVLALDLGSSSLRGILGCWDENRKTLQRREILRVPHQAKLQDGVLQWDLETLTNGAIQALVTATEILGKTPDSLAVDGWGVDVVVVDENNRPCAPARAYRDPAGARGRAVMAERLNEDRGYQLTGVFPQDINTCYQLAACGSGAQASVLDQPVASIMFLADYLARTLLLAPIEGLPYPGADPGPWASLAVASTSGLVQANRLGYNAEVLAAAGMQAQWLAPLASELTVAGQRGALSVIRAGSHDTACALYSLGDPQAQFISCGSWAIAGVSTEQATLGPQALAAGVTNEASASGRNRAQLNLTGLWLAQECRRTWADEGFTPSYEEQDRLCGQAKSLGIVLDVNEAELLSPGDMPGKINRLAAKQLGSCELERGQILKLISESVAHASAQAIKTLRELTGAAGRVYLMGGGVRDRHLVADTAKALGETLYLGDPEASALGNILAQLHVLGVSEKSINQWRETTAATPVASPSLAN